MVSGIGITLKHQSLYLLSLVVSQEDAGKDGAADAMPGTADGAGKDG